MMLSIFTRVVEVGFKNVAFYFFYKKTEKLKSPNFTFFSFFRKTFKIQIF